MPVAEEPYKSDVKPINLSDKYWKRYKDKYILIPHRKLHIEEERFLDTLLNAAPYYFLKYGDKALELLQTKLTGTPLIVLVIMGIRKGLSWLNKRLRIE